MKKIFSFTFKNIIVVFFILFVTSYFNTITINVYNRQYLTQYTYYYPGDATGSGYCTGSGKCIDSFTKDENGWYYYETNGEKYLVVAAALNICKNSANHCGINVSKHGIAQNINYYDYYDVLNLSINGKSYKAMVLDACGACMWGRQDQRGQELFDIFVENGSSQKPNSNNENNPLIGNQKPSLEHFGTSYTGDITQGWIYKRFEFSETFNHELPDYMAESNINDIIDIIFNRAKTSYFSVLSNMSGLIGNIDAGSFDSWLQCDSNWGDIHLGSTSHTICSAGCAATSIAIQIARSGVPLSLNGNLNPGSFVSALNQNGGFTSGGAIYWGKASVVAPNFQYNNSDGLKGNSSSKIATLANYLLSGNNYIVAHVNGSKNGTTSNHWVAVTGVTNSDVMMIDPSGRGTSLNSAYGLEYLDEIRIYTVK